MIKIFLVSLVLFLMLVILTSFMNYLIFIQSGTAIKNQEKANSFLSNSINSTDTRNTRADLDDVNHNNNITDTISIGIFFDPSCPCTQYAKQELKEVEKNFSNIEIHNYNISISQNLSKMIDFFEAYNVPYNIRIDTPFLFIGDYYLHHYGVSYENISRIIEYYQNKSVPLWPQWQLTWSMHIAVFFDPEVNFTNSMFEILMEIDTTWNSGENHLIVHMYPFTDPKNELLMNAYFSYFNLSKITSYKTPSEIYAGVFIGDVFYLNMDIDYRSLNNTVLEYSGMNTPLKDITPDLTGGNICILFFYSSTCGTCNSARTIIENLKSKYPNLDVHEYNIGDPDNLILQHSYFEHYGVDTEYRGSLGVFIGDTYFIVNDVENGNFRADLEEQIKRYENGCDCPDVEANKDLVKEEFLSFTVLAVLAAGLVDSINPCAIATLIFFIGYLSATGRSRKQVLIIGMAYTLGIFITYMLLGLGLYSIISTASNEIEAIAMGLYPTMAVVTFIFAFYSIYDFKKARIGKKEEMKLQLPKPVKGLIGRVIKEQVKLRYFAVIAIVTGVIISTLEFLCTGQVYLPTIVVVVRTVPEFQGQAVLLLLLYNIMFVLPLIIIFSAVYRGMSSEQLQQKLEKNRALFKLMTAIVFFILGAILLWYSLEILV